MSAVDVRRGEYRIIRVDGTEELIEAKPTIDAVCKAIGCDCIDTVSIGKNRANGSADLVMMVDDTGMVDKKPLNPKATALYHSVCKPGTVFGIHGDVAIVRDEDFA